MGVAGVHPVSLASFEPVLDSQHLLLVVVEAHGVVMAVLDEGETLAGREGESETVVELGADVVELKTVLTAEEVWR